MSAPQLHDVTALLAWLKALEAEGADGTLGLFTKSVADQVRAKLGPEIPLHSDGCLTREVGYDALHDAVLGRLPVWLELEAARKVADDVLDGIEGIGVCVDRNVPA